MPLRILVFWTLLLAACLAHGSGRKLARTLLDGATRHLPDSVVAVNLYELLGPAAYTRGVFWEPMACYDSAAKSMDGPTETKLAKLEGLMMQDLLQVLSSASGVPVDRLTNSSSFPGASRIPGFSQALLDADPRYARAALRRLAGRPAYWSWLRRLSGVVARHTVVWAEEGRGVRRAYAACMEEKVKEVLRIHVDPAPGVDCNDEGSLLAHTGLFPDAALPLEQIVRRVVREPGWCAMQPQYEPYGVWLKKERILKRRRLRDKKDGVAAGGDDGAANGGAAASTAVDANGDQRFRFDNRHKDRVVFLFDLLYEVEHAFKRQHWLGAVAQQNPFDMYAIMDIIHTAAPDLIIETGTANGGSALMWASMLELTAPGAGKVITIDVVPPQAAGRPGERIRDPRRHRLWTKYVNFLKGSSTDDAVLFRVRAAASAASRVLVLLDSHHGAQHVEAELRNYCPLVTAGSYCVVQDTKLSRFGAVGGPAPAIQAFLETHREFVADREREPFYTQHVGGYLRRVNGSYSGGAQ